MFWPWAPALPHTAGSKCATRKGDKTLYPSLTIKLAKQRKNRPPKLTFYRKKNAVKVK